MSYYGNNSSTGGGPAGGFHGQQPYGGQNQQYGGQQQQQQQSNAYQTGYGDSSGWQQQQQYTDQSSQQQQQQQYHQNSYAQPQPQAQQPAPAFWNPAAAASMAAMVTSTVASGGSLSNDAVLNLASSAGKSFLQSGTARMIPGLDSAMMSLRTYFAVHNRYVLRKMKRVLFPILVGKQDWHRKVMQSTNQGTPTLYELPLSDDNAPDLYLPLMCLITYVLLSALCYGTAGEFNPEVIPDVAFKCALYQTLEVIVFRGGFYAMQVPASILDLVSYTGYKYLGLCVNMIVGIIVGHFGLFGARGYYACFLWTATAAAYFILKTMSNYIPLQTSSMGPKREVMIIAFAALQYFTIWMVSQTKFL